MTNKCNNESNEQARRQEAKKSVTSAIGVMTNGDAASDVDKRDERVATTRPTSDRKDRGDKQAGDMGSE